jgi:RNA polymerase sigma-70 factor (TIGR02943 family)
MCFISMGSPLGCSTIISICQDPCGDDFKSEETIQLNPEGWVTQYGDMLFRFALHRVNDKTVAEDLVQESLLAAMKAKDRFQGQSSERTWLFAILKHKIIDYFRSKNHWSTGIKIETFAEADEHFNENGTWRLQPRHWDVNPHKVFEQKEFIDALYRCLSQIAPRTADAFVYREIDGLTTEEICKILNITATNCGVMLYRARMSLRRCLEKTYAAPSGTRK